MSFQKYVKRICTLFALVCCGVSNANSVTCPAVEPSEGIFDATSISNDLRISIEHEKGVHSLTLVIYLPTSHGCKREEFAHCSLKGSAPTIDSLVFTQFEGRANVLTIVSWTVNSRGDGVYGRLYQVHAYNMG